MFTRTLNVIVPALLVIFASMQPALALRPAPLTGPGLPVVAVSVPAPIIGAGLPALAVLGGGYWLVRKLRKTR
jgi:hypothetical protein